MSKVAVTKNIDHIGWIIYDDVLSEGLLLGKARHVLF
jgi:hypothetical protein